MKDNLKPILFSLLVLIFFSEVLEGYSQEADSTKVSHGSFQKYRFGGYGEILYQQMDFAADRYSDPAGALPENRAFIGLPRFVFSFDYKLRNDLIFGSEIEFEHGGTGSALELEYEEAGEYEMEMEKAGEVVLEQLHFTKVFRPWFMFRVGHMIIPVGQTNARHESIMYYGAVRPESEASIVPLTWHETGISILGNYRKWSYQLFLINGLDANGFSSAYWIRDGKQGIFEDVKMTDPAFAFRLENNSIRNLRLSTSGYLGNSTGNTAKPEKMDHLDGTVSIISADMEFRNRRFGIRGNVIYGNLADSYEIAAINKTISKNIQYQRTPVAQNALAYGAEIGYNFYTKQPGTRITPFFRYEYYNSMENTVGGMHADKRYQRDICSIGCNYFITPSVAVKADYSHRRIGLGDYNDENTFNLAFVYTGWFINK